MLIAIDMDDLKYINDTYGHIQGDNAIQLLGKALSYSSMGKEICARVGGDEFNVIAGDYSQDELDDFMSSVLNYIESYNEISDVPYNINASYGVILVREFSQGDLEYYMNISDDLMYKQKGAKKKENGVIKGKDTLKTQ